MAANHGGSSIDRNRFAAHCRVRFAIGEMKTERSLIWIQGDGDVGWACSNCRWRFPVPTLLASEEGREAYDRLAAAKFRQHNCEDHSSLPFAEEAAHNEVAEQAKVLIKRGYKPRDAVELVLQETALESRNDERVMKKARADGDDFLQKLSKGLI